MSVIEMTMLVAWLVWVGFYVWLVLTYSASRSRSYAMLLFPVLLYFNSSWRPGSDLVRTKVLVGALALVILQATLIYTGVLSAT